jgi:hypothetical protein
MQEAMINSARRPDDFSPKAKLTNSNRMFAVTVVGEDFAPLRSPNQLDYLKDGQAPPSGSNDDSAVQIEVEEGDDMEFDVDISDDEDVELE